MICPRCLGLKGEQVVHNCIPTEFVRGLEADIEADNISLCNAARAIQGRDAEIQALKEALTNLVSDCMAFRLQ